MSQSIICALLTPPPYVLFWPGGTTPRNPPIAAARRTPAPYLQPQRASAVAMASMPSAACRSRAAGTRLVMNAKLSTRPLVS